MINYWTKYLLWNEPVSGFVTFEAADAPSAIGFCCATVEGADTFEGAEGWKYKWMKERVDLEMDKSDNFEILANYFIIWISNYNF